MNELMHFAHLPPNAARVPFSKHLTLLSQRQDDATSPDGDSGSRETTTAYLGEKGAGGKQRPGSFG